MDRRRTWQSPAGFEASVLSNADEAFYTCMHAATHGFHRLRWLYDLIAIARVLKPEERMCVRQLAVRHGQSGHFFAAAIAAREFFGETPDLGCSGLPVPWTHPNARQIRRMVERVEGNTASLRQKAGYRLDLFRMTQSPWQAVELLACFANREMRRLLCQLRPVDPGALARTLPD
jgi:hypothetical protein